MTAGEHVPDQGSGTTGNVFPELGCYGLAGHSATPVDLLAEARLAEQLGLGTMFLSERFNTKDAGVLAGAVAASTTRLGIGTAATNPHTRHPSVTATMGMTMHRLSQGRYALGLGRGFDLLWDLMGVPRVTSAQLTDTIDILRRLWHGEAVSGHEGPAGSFPYLSLDPSFDEDIPVLMMAIGPRTQALAGRIADGVVLHTFFDDAATAAAVTRIRHAAEQAGRDPAQVRIWSVLATVTDELSEEEQLRRLVGRLATYLQGYGDVLVAANGWDQADLARFRADDLVQGYPGAFDAVGTAEELRHLRDDVLPAHWLAASATGSAGSCARSVAAQFDLGVDSVILHGATPEQLGPVLEHYPDVRPAGAVRRLPANPGRTSGD